MAQFIVWGLILVAALGALAAAARELRRILVPAADGLIAIIADGVLVVSGLVLVSQIWGSFGEFRRVPLALTMIGVGVSGWWLLRGRGPQPVRPVPQRPASGLASTIAIGGCAVVVAQWASWLAPPLHEGITDYDSLEYHLTLAARFAQSGSVAHLHYISPDSPVHLYPMNSELLHAVGMLFLHSDLLSIFLNIGWLLAAIACGWVIGRRFDCAPSCALAVALVMAVPLIASTQAGSAGNDAPIVAFFLAALAMFLALPRTRGSLFLVGLAAGLALGAKVTVVAPCLALGVSVVALAPDRGRLRAGIVWCAGAAVTCGYWYARNLLDTGSPNPAVHLGPLPHAKLLLLDKYGFSVAHYMVQPHAWLTMLIPGLASLGLAWPALLVIVAFGAVWAASRGSTELRALGLITVISAVAFVLTPAVALGPEGGPSLYALNLRYLAPALALGVILVVIFSARRSSLWNTGITVLLGLCLILTLVPTSDWPPWPTSYQRFGAEAGALAGALFLVGCFGGRRALAAMRPRWAAPAPLAVACGAVALLAVALLAVENHRYQPLRYAQAGLYTWVDRHLERSRIAIAGIDRQYPLYGPDLSNYVQYVGTVLPHGGFTRVADCRNWLTLLRGGRFGYVVTRADALIGYPWGYVPESRWTSLDRGARLLFADAKATVFRLSHPPDPAVCPAGAAGRSPVPAGFLVPIRSPKK